MVRGGEQSVTDYIGICCYTIGSTEKKESQARDEGNLTHKCKTNFSNKSAVIGIGEFFGCFHKLKHNEKSEESERFLSFECKGCDQNQKIKRTPVGVRFIWNRMKLFTWQLRRFRLLLHGSSSRCARSEAVP